MDGKTKVYGVMGDPIEHSMSPLMHNFYAERTRNRLSLRSLSRKQGNCGNGCKRCLCFKYPGNECNRST